MHYAGGLVSFPHPHTFFSIRLSQIILVNSCKLKDFPFRFFSLSLYFCIHDLQWHDYGSVFFCGSGNFFGTHKKRSIRNQAHDGNIIIVATKTLRLQPNYSKMNVILTWFQHNFVSVFFYILINIITIIIKANFT